MKENDRKELERMRESLEYLVTWIDALLEAIDEDSISKTNVAYKQIFKVGDKDEEYYTYERDVIERVRIAMYNFWEGASDDHS